MEPQNSNPNVDIQNSDPNGAQPAPEENLPAETLEGQLAAVTVERDRLAAEKAELDDRFLRTRAEFENARRRADRDRMEFVQFAAMDLVRSLLPVLDDFERAVKTEATDQKYAKGVELIYQRLLETLKKAGLEPIEAQGKTFDPNFHEAVQRVSTEDAPDQTVMEEFQRGYNFKGKLLRPAWVKVAVKP